MTEFSEHGCPGCRAAVDLLSSLNLLDGRLAGPITSLRVRSTQGESNLRLFLVTCSNCGLVCTYDAAWVQAELDATAHPPPR